MTSDDDHGAEVVREIWRSLKAVEDPEIPVSVVDMGLIVSVAYDGVTHAAILRITYTAMGCPAMEMIQDDIRACLIRIPEVDRVDIDVVWDPVWSPRRLSHDAKRAMRDLGIAV